MHFHGWRHEHGKWPRDYMYLMQSRNWDKKGTKLKVLGLLNRKSRLDSIAMMDVSHWPNVRHVDLSYLVLETLLFALRWLYTPTPLIYLISISISNSGTKIVPANTLDPIYGHWITLELSDILYQSPYPPLHVIFMSSHKICLVALSSSVNQQFIMHYDTFYNALYPLCAMYYECIYRFKAFIKKNKCGHEL